MDEKPQVKKLKLDKSTVKDLQASVDGPSAADPRRKELAPPTKADPPPAAYRGRALAPPTH